MKILVTVKRVIDYNVQVRVKADNSGVEKENVKMSMNPPDENAVEEALRIKEADLLLGIFGNSNKAGNVIPNKVFQSLASGKTVITRKSNAYPKQLSNLNNGIIFIQPNDPEALYNTVLKITNDKRFLRKSNAQAKIIYDNYFSGKVIREQLRKVLKLSI